MSSRRSTPLRALLLGFALPMLSAAVAEGQEVRVTVEGGQLRDALGNTGSGAMIRPELLWRQATASARLGGLVSVLGGQSRVGAIAAAEQRVGLKGPFDLHIASDGSALRAGSHSLRRARAGGSVRLGGSWASLEVGPFARWRARQVTMSGSAPGGLFGFAPQQGEGKLETATSAGIQAAATVRRGPFATRIGWTTERMSADLVWSDWVAGVAIVAGPVTLAAEGGRRAGAVQESWAAMRLGLDVAEGVQLTGELGSSPSDPLGGYQGGEVAMVGVSLSAGGGRQNTPPLRPAPLPDGRTRLTIRAPAGSRVELLGDWTRWSAQPVVEVEPGLFVADVQLKPGTHRFAFRVDGRWTVPPGYRSEPDDYGGKRAVVEVGLQAV